MIISKQSAEWILPHIGASSVRSSTPLGSSKSGSSLLAKSGSSLLTITCLLAITGISVAGITKTGISKTSILIVIGHTSVTVGILLILTEWIDRCSESVCACSHLARFNLIGTSSAIYIDLAVTFAGSLLSAGTAGYITWRPFTPFLKSGTHTSDTW